MNERERIELLMKSYGMTPSQFADRTGIQRASVSHIISGRNKPSLEVLQKIYEAFPELDIKWLMTGNGEEPVAKGMQGDDTNENFLFPPESRTVPPSVTVAEPEQVVPQPKAQAAKPVQRKMSAPKVRLQPFLERKIKEIRIFYTDGTYETMYPEK